MEDYDSARKSDPANNHKGGTDEKRPCGGTGVFLPRHNRRLSMDADLKLMAAPHVSYGGTGVFINPQFHRPAAHRRTKSKFLLNRVVQLINRSTIYTRNNCSITVSSNRKCPVND